MPFYPIAPSDLELSGPYGPHREIVSNVLTIPIPITDDDNVSAAATPVADTDATAVQSLLVPSTLMFHMATGTGSASFLVTGKNQFGEDVSETVTLTTVADVDDKVTLHCYSKITSIHCTSADSATDVNVGQNWNHATLRQHLALPVKLSSSEVSYVSFADVVAAAPTIVEEPYYKIEVPQLAMASASVAHLVLADGVWIRT